MGLGHEEHSETMTTYPENVLYRETIKDLCLPILRIVIIRYFSWGQFGPQRGY